ncbi:hypothetical protein DFJ74DRAFT_140632 [Hyaloraphidium curvatum]|nr:hypothetical protein DFJ74DRAFT_140632 [Hyaloraphidium curvatum]
MEPGSAAAEAESPSPTKVQKVLVLRRSHSKSHRRRFRLKERARSRQTPETASSVDVGESDVSVDGSKITEVLENDGNRDPGRRSKLRKARTDGEPELPRPPTLDGGVSINGPLPEEPIDASYRSADPGVSHSGRRGEAELSTLPTFPSRMDSAPPSLRGEKHQYSGPPSRKPVKSAPAFDYSSTRSRLEHLIPVGSLEDDFARQQTPGESAKNKTRREPEAKKPKETKEGAPRPVSPSKVLSRRVSLNPVTRHEMRLLQESMMQALRGISEGGPSGASASGEPSQSQVHASAALALEIRYPCNPSELLHVVREEHDIYHSVFAEIVRQSTVSMRERGMVLHEIRSRYKDMFKKVPGHLKHLYQELGKHRAFTGGVGIQLEQLDMDLDRLERALERLSEGWEAGPSAPRSRPQTAAETKEHLAPSLTRGRKRESRQQPNLGMVAEAETISLQERLHAAEKEISWWTMQASAMASAVTKLSGNRQPSSAKDPASGLDTLHYRANLIHRLLTEQVSALHGHLFPILEAAWPIIAEFRSVVAEIAASQAQNDSSDVEELSVISTEMQRFHRSLVSRLETEDAATSAFSRGKTVLREADLPDGLNTAAEYAFKDVSTVCRSMIRWQDRLHSILEHHFSVPEKPNGRSSGDKPQPLSRATYLLGKAQAPLETLAVRLEKLEALFPPSKGSQLHSPDPTDGLVGDTEAAFQRCKRWISQQKIRASGKDGKLDALSLLLHELEDLVTRSERLLAEIGDYAVVVGEREGKEGDVRSEALPVSFLSPLPMSATQSLFAMRRSICESMDNWHLRIRSTLALFACETDSEGFPLEDGTRVAASLQELMSVLGDSLRQSVQEMLGEECEAKWRRMCKWLVAAVADGTIGNEPERERDLEATVHAVRELLGKIEQSLSELEGDVAADALRRHVEKWEAVARRSIGSGHSLDGILTNDLSMVFDECE